MIPRLKPTLGWGELAVAWTPGRTGDVERFERSFAELMGQRHALAFPYGRTGLLLLLQALGLEGREVICPAYTCVVVPHAIVASGNEPVFVDCAESSFNMDLELAEAAITPATGALIATSLFGYPVDLDRLDALRERHPGLIIIQDCAHSFAATWRGRAVQVAGRAAIFGLNISKLITSIFGGMVTTDDDELAGRLRRLRDDTLAPCSRGKDWRRRAYLTAVYAAFSGPVYGAVNRLERHGLLDRFVRYYDDATIDLPSDHLVAMSTVEARVGRRQLHRYHSIVEHRHVVARHYDAGLADLGAVILPPLLPGATYSHYVPRVSNRPQVVDASLGFGVQLGELIEYCIPEMPAYAGRHGSRGKYPRASELSRTTINLPLHCNIRSADRVISALRRSI